MLAEFDVIQLVLGGLLCGGVCAWLLLGRVRRLRRYRGVAGYLTIAVLLICGLFALTRRFWTSHQYPTWLGAWSVVTYLMYLVDKRAAQRGQDRRGNSKATRIDELALHLAAVLGGFVGALLGRHQLRHKTRKPIFAVVIVVAAALHIGIYVKLM